MSNPTAASLIRGRRIAWFPLGSAAMLTRQILSIVASLLGFAASAAAAEPPNIIYILMDDAGYADISCYGQKKFSTPNIDRLATEGIKFTDHYAGSTVCAPTRSVLMTGLHTGHTPVRGNKEVKPVGQSPIPSSTYTVAEALSEAGYATGSFGKWGLGYPGSEGAPEKQGFDRFYGYNCQRNAHTYYPTWLFDNDKKIELDGVTYAHDPIMDEALKFIRSNKDKPFFCFLPVTIPHASMHVPEKYAAPFRKKFPQFADKVGKYAGPNVKNPVAMFAGMMTKLDEDVGRVLDLVKELGLDDNTIIMLTSDNGPHREGGHMPDFFDSNGPLKGYKRDLYEGGIRVPLIARWPGKIKAGSESDLVSAHWDIFPTFCELADKDAPTNLDGISLVPTLLGEGEQKKHEYLYWEFHERNGARAVRFGEWKAVQNNLKKKDNPPIEIYNLADDIGETKDLAKENPALVARARGYFKAAHSPSQIWKMRGEK
jgi:arylsulfatase A